MSQRLRFIPLLTATLLALVAVPASASAGYEDIYKECQDGTLTNTYTAKELQQAAQHLDGYNADYTQCSDAIARAQTAGTKRTTTKKAPTGGGAATSGGGASQGSGGQVGGGSAPTTTQEQAPPEQKDAVGAASDASTIEDQTAVANALKAAQAANAAQEIKLQGVKVPASALNLGDSGAAVPVPLLLALIACGTAACAAGLATLVQAVRRRRAR